MQTISRYNFDYYVNSDLFSNNFVKNISAHLLGVTGNDDDDDDADAEWFARIKASQNK